MAFEINKYLNANPEMKGFRLEFESRADLDGGFECYIFANGTHVSFVTGKGAYSTGVNGSGVKYRHYYCRIGDDAYLKKFLEVEGIMDNPPRLRGDYGAFFFRLIDKVMSYGTGNKKVMPMYLPERNEEPAAVLSH